LAPPLTAIPHFRVLVAICVVDVASNTRQTAGLVENPTELVAQIASLLVESGPIGSIGNQRSRQEMSVAEGKCARSAVDSLDALDRVALKHKQGALKGRGAPSGRRKHLVGLFLGIDIV
jgi:hypothetical protein